MRFSKLTAYGASVVISAALLAGCSNSSQGSSLLGGTNLNGGAAISQQQLPAGMKGGRIDPRELLKLQAEGKMLAPIPREGAERDYKYIMHHPKFQAHRAASGTPAMWVSNTDYDYLVGVNKKANEVLSTVYTPDNGCYEPITLKTDRHKNVWTACEEGPTFEAGAEQEYSSTGTYEGSYNASGAGDCPTGNSCYSSSYDGGFDTSGHVFLEQSEAYTFSCTTYYCYFDYLAPGVWWWNASSPTATPTFIELSSYDDPAEYMIYMAVDGSGNIWFDYDGTSNSTYGCGVGEIANPTTSPTVNFYLRPGTLEFCGGMSVVGSDLYVTDQEARVTYEYALPLTTSSTPIATLGPTAVGLGGYGDPVSGGFSNTGSSLIQGDNDGWLDMTTVPGNTNTAVTNIDFLPGIEGAAFTKSTQP